MEKVNNLDKKKLLVVGGTGFIGTHVVKEALARGFQVSVISNNDKSLTFLGDWLSKYTVTTLTDDKIWQGNWKEFIELS